MVARMKTTIEMADPLFGQARDLAARQGTKAPLASTAVHDARIAALCLQQGVREIWTADRYFGRFAGLKSRNPLV